MDKLIELASLIRAHNTITTQIASLIQRPAFIGHIGEFIAASIFEISLVESASNKSIDGSFDSGQLTGKSVNIKWYTKRENLLDITPNALPDFYLVLTGEKQTASSSRGKTRPWVIKSVYLFDAHQLVGKLYARKIKIGIATSVAKVFWNEAEIYPTPSNSELILSKKQQDLLKYFHSDNVAFT